MSSEHTSERVATRAQLYKAQSIRELADDMAHDLTNVLLVIVANTERLRTLVPCERCDIIDEIERAVDRASDVARRLLALSHPG